METFNLCSFLWFVYLFDSPRLCFTMKSRPTTLHTYYTLLIYTYLGTSFSTLFSFPQEKGEPDKNDVDFPFSVSLYRAVIFICLLLSPQTSKSWRGRIRSPSRYSRHSFRRNLDWQRTTSSRLRSTRSCPRIKIRMNGSRENHLIMSNRRRTRMFQKMTACKAWRANMLTPFTLKACIVSLRSL